MVTSFGHGCGGWVRRGAWGSCTAEAAPAGAHLYEKQPEMRYQFAFDGAK